MKTPEDEAFDDLARRQGAWGGGFKAKRAMAADKLQDGKCKYCVEGCIACDARAQPAQEPVAVWELQEDGWDTICDGDWLKTLPVGTKLYTTPPQRPWVGLTKEETSGFTSHEMTVVKYVSKVLQEKNT